MIAIFFSFSFLSISFINSIFFTSKFVSAADIYFFCLVIYYSVVTFYFSTSTKYFTLIFSILSNFFSNLFGIVGFVTLTDIIYIPGAHFLRSFFKDFINYSSNLLKISMYISWREWTEQNLFISWWILSVIHIF